LGTKTNKFEAHKINDSTVGLCHLIELTLNLKVLLYITELSGVSYHSTTLKQFKV